MNRSNVTRGVFHILLVLAAIAAVSACSQQPAPAAAAPQAPPLETIATTRQVMLGITGPTSDVVFQVGAAAPKDAAEWEKVQASAAALAESANLLMTGPRAVDQQEWATWCKTLIKTSKLAAEAAQERNVDKVLDAGNQVYEVCDGCHKKYMAARAGEQSSG